jgi:hypothetical protein
MTNGNIAFSVFLLDVYCLGVKDAFFQVGTLEEYENMVAKARMNMSLIVEEATCVRKLTEDCVEYAKNIGFMPHKDYQKARKIFGDIDSTNCLKTYTFGKNGKPLYISGPFDNQQKIEMIRKTLIKNCGEENFDFIVALPETGF